MEQNWPLLTYCSVCVIIDQVLYWMDIIQLDNQVHLGHILISKQAITVADSE